MSTLLRRLGIVVALAVSAFAFSLTTAGQAVAQNVKPILAQVINGSDNPVPVIGTVHVANTAAAPVVARDLSDFAARNAFSQQVTLDFEGGARAGLTIPAGKRLVTECVSVFGSDFREGGDPDIALIAGVGGGSFTSYRLTPVRVQPSGLNAWPDAFASTQLVRFYADTLIVSITFGVGTTDRGHFIVTVSGYLVDQP